MRGRMNVKYLSTGRGVESHRTGEEQSMLWQQANEHASIAMVQCVW